VVTPEHADAAIARISGPRRASVIASAAIAQIDRLLIQADLAPVRARLADEIEALRLDFPSLNQIQCLRDDVGARTPLARLIREEAERLFLESDAAMRLGLPAGSALVNVRAAAQDGSQRWRSLINTSRIPFSARPAAEVIERCYNQLWAETLTVSQLAELSGQ
jgi:hypothetical protein